MSNWKKDRLTIEVKESEKKIMAEAAARHKAEEDAAWSKIEDLCTEELKGDTSPFEIFNWFKENYELPKKKS